MTRGQRSQFIAIVKENLPLCREHFRLTLLLPQFPATEPGQFVQLLCRDPGDQSAEVEVDWNEDRPLEGHRDPFEPQAMLRRPFSLAGRRDLRGGVELDVIHRVVGVGTEWLSQLKLGDNVSVLGPLGNQFELPPPREMGILVAGGVGIPPMLYLAEKLKGRAIAFCGATTRDLLPFTLGEMGDEPFWDPALRVAEFARLHIPSVVTTDDSTFGYGGYVTQALEQYLESVTDPPPFTIYTCGPELMMKRVADIAISRRIPCQVAVERAMACGMGTCQSCCIRVREGSGVRVQGSANEGWRYKLACTDGPIFAAADLLW